MIKKEPLNGEPFLSKAFTVCLSKFEIKEMSDFMNFLGLFKEVENIKSFEVDREKQNYFGKFSFPHSKPDLCLRIIKENDEEFFVVFEVKVDENFFSLSKNQDQLNYHLSAISSNPNAVLIGISDKYYVYPGNSAFYHKTWNQIFDYFDKSNNSAVNLLLRELKEYKNQDNLLLERFHPDFNMIIAKIVNDDSDTTKELQNQYYTQISQFFNNISHMINREFDHTLYFQNQDLSNGYFLLRQRLLVKFPAHINYQLQFRSYYKPNKEFIKIFLGVVVLPKVLDDSFFGQFKKEFEALSLYQNEDNGFENEFIIKFSMNDKLDWSNPKWVERLRNEISSKSIQIIKVINKIIINRA